MSAVILAVRSMQASDPGGRSQSEVPSAPLETVELVRRIRTGDGDAREMLFRRYLPLLRRWAHGRLPTYARDQGDTDDLVQVTLLRALNRIEDFDVRHPGSFLAYLRQILLNEVRGEVRRMSRMPSRDAMPENIVETDVPTVLEQLVGAERLQAYQNALAELPRRQQEILVMRLEFGMTYPEIAVELGANADAVRIMATRAAAELARRLGQVYA